MKFSKIFTVVVGILPATLVMADMSATSTDFGHSHDTTRLIADLVPLSSTTDIGQGEIRYIAGSKGQILNSGITLPVDGATLDSNGAAKATATLTIGSATCTLSITMIRFINSSKGVKESANYELAVSSYVKTAQTHDSNSLPAASNPTFHIGSCANNILPTITSGGIATVTVTLSGQSSPLTTLQGTFQ